MLYVYEARSHLRAEFANARVGPEGRYLERGLVQATLQVLYIVYNLFIACLRLLLLPSCREWPWTKRLARAMLARGTMALEFPLSTRPEIYAFI